MAAIDDKNGPENHIISELDKHYYLCGQLYNSTKNDVIKTKLMQLRQVGRLAKEEILKLQASGSEQN